MRKLLLIFAMALILSLTFIQAPEVNEEPVEVVEIALPIEPLEDKAGWTIDNKYDFNPNIDLGKAEIKSTIFWIIPSDPIEDITLKQNTFTCEGSITNPCLAEKEITIYKDTKLVDEAVFDGRIKSYKFQIRTSHKLVTRTEIVHECTENTKCTDKEVEVSYYDDKWIDYNYEVMPKGTYTLRLVGYKVKASDDVEWYVVSQGELIEEWANWGASTLTTDLRNYYNFDEGSGTTVYDSLFTHNGTKQGNFAWNSTAKLGTYAGKFPDDGSSHVQLGNISSNGIAQFTISAWINAANLGKYQNVLSRTGGGDSFKTMIRDSNVLQMCIGGACIWGTNTLNQGVWYHAVYVYNGVNQTIFLNGVWEQSGARTGVVPAVSGVNALIGRDESDTASDFDGLIDEVGFWNRSLTYSEIQSLYNSATGRTYPFALSSITLNSPLDNYASSNPLVNFSANISHSAQLVNASLWHNATGTWARNQTISLTGLTNQSVFSASFADGTYKWGVQACDTDGDCGFSSTNRTFTIDTNAPNVTILYPSGVINALTNGQTLGLNFSIIHPPSNITDCWREYNGINTSIANCYGNTTFTYVSGVNTIKLWANDSTNNKGFGISTWSESLKIESVNYSLSTTESNLETFVLRTSYNSTLYTSLSSTFYYDSIAYPTIIAGSAGNQTLTATLNVPSVSVQTNKTFLWALYFTGYNFNSTNYNQTINPIVFSICGPTNKIAFINFTTKSATSPFALINSSFKSTWTLATNSGLFVKNYTYEDTSQTNNTFAFCSNANGTYYATSSIEYTAANYASNFYYLNNASISNQVQNISLYLLNDTLATATVIKVINSAQSGQAGLTAQIQAFDTGTNSYNNVAMIQTDFNGQGLAYLNWYDTNYRFILYRSNALLMITNNTQIVETPTIITLSSSITQPFDKFNDFVYNLTWINSTKTFTLTFTKPSGLVETGCLRVTKRNSTSDSVICLVCDTASSASLSCDISNQTNGTYFGAFYATGSYKLVDWIESVIGGNFAKEIYDLLSKEDRIFYAFMFAGIVMSIMFIHPALGILGLIMGIVGGAALGFTIINYLAFMGIVIVGGVIIWFIKR